MIRTFYSDHFAVDIGGHVMPMRKFALVKKRLLERGLSTCLVEAPPATDVQLLRVHSPGYIKAVATGEPRALAESQKFPWSKELALSVRWTNGAVIAATEAALEDGVACALASGFHHAHADHGEGFCTFNGLVVALEDARAAGRIERALIVDLDLHYGNGTASLVGARSWLSSLSIYGSWYEGNHASLDVTTKRAPDTERSWSIAVPNGASGKQYLDTVEQALLPAIRRARPDVILYQAGADPYREDPYSPLNVGIDDLAARDALVFQVSHASGIPIAWVLAGGYTKDISKIVDVHSNTFAAAAQVFQERGLPSSG
jgi:acetoin utilization deacetylase AcuC-like enzyme